MSKKLFSAISTSAVYLVSAGLVFAQDKALEAPAGSIGTNVDATALPQFVLNLVFYAAAFLAILYLMYGGIRWMTSRGDKTAVESARRHVVAAIVGLVVVIGAFFTVNTVFRLTGGCNPLDPKNFQLPTVGGTTKKC